MKRSQPPYFQAKDIQYENFRPMTNTVSLTRVTGILLRRLDPKVWPSVISEIRTGNLSILRITDYPTVLRFAVRRSGSFYM